ncbi:dihydroorotate dehydrogenase electron transfer subunit [Candidatus Electrothrix sp.]|uniref:dihydroorotate dehydrogenase electron transfer subunit n=1 Tax=Candidatus Electrothrix sp. TaxID=2170559 RepID=UPI004057994D
MSEFQQKCTLLARDCLAPDVVRLTFQAPKIAVTARPGQFVMVRVIDGLDPLLRRPFSIHRSSADGTISLLFKVIGKGTEILAQRCVGDQLDLVGPLGKGFDFSGEQPVCLIGGGMGIAPLLFLAEQLEQSGRETQKDHVLLGARNKDELAPLAEEFSALGYAVQLASDDGSVGHKGFIPDLLDFVLPSVEQVYTCGPHLMMENIVGQCQQAEVSCQVSLETHMACGMGACLGCTVHGKRGLVHVCKQGPVFNADVLAWGEI